jgi:hypothetical protein
VLVNGARHSYSADTTTEGLFKSLHLTLNLRAGINTVAISSASTRFELYSLETIDVMVRNKRGRGEEGKEPLPTRGTRMAYQAYEAEDNECGGTILGPTYIAYTDTIHLASEASQRMACQLAVNRSHTETLVIAITTPANALRLRYSIQDAPQGGGTRNTLRLVGTSKARPSPGDSTVTVPTVLVDTTVLLTSEFS